MTSQLPFATLLLRNVYLILEPQGTSYESPRRTAPQSPNGEEDGSKHSEVSTGQGNGLSQPHGGTLFVGQGTFGTKSDYEAPEGRQVRQSHVLSRREQDDLEMILSGAFSPLTGFMVRYEYRSVLDRMRIGPEPDALLFPVPVTLGIRRDAAARIVIGSTLYLHDEDQRPLAALEVQDKYTPDLREEARLVFGTDDPAEHPGVADALRLTGSSSIGALSSNTRDQAAQGGTGAAYASIVYVGGPLRRLEPVRHFDFREERLGPARVRAMAASRKWTGMAAILTRSPLLGPQLAILKHAASLSGGGALVLATGGQAASCSRRATLPYAVRVHCVRRALRDTGADIVTPGPGDTVEDTATDGQDQSQAISIALEGRMDAAVGADGAETSRENEEGGLPHGAAVSKESRGGSSAAVDSGSSAEQVAKGGPRLEQSASSSLQTGRRLRSETAAVAGAPTKQPNGDTSLQAILGLLPLAGRAAGPRAALWHMIIMKNYGATHVVIGRNHGSCSPAGDEGGRDGSGMSGRSSYYGHYDAYTTAVAYSEELGLSVIGARKLLWVPRLGTLLPADLVSATEVVEHLSEGEFRKRLATGLPVPPWYCPPSVLQLLREAVPPTARKGVVVLLSGSNPADVDALSKGVHSVLLSVLGSRGRNAVVRLDGRQQVVTLGRGWGPEFDPLSCEAATSRLGYVASQIARHGSVVLVGSSSGSEAARLRVGAHAAEEGAAYMHFHVLPQEESDIALKQSASQTSNAKIREAPGTWFEWPASADAGIDPSSISVQDATMSIIGRLLADGFAGGVGAGATESLQSAIIGWQVLRGATEEGLAASAQTSQADKPQEQLQKQNDSQADLGPNQRVEQQTGLSELGDEGTETPVSNGDQRGSVHVFSGAILEGSTSLEHDAVPQSSSSSHNAAALPGYPGVWAAVFRNGIAETATSPARATNAWLHPLLCASQSKGSRRNALRRLGAFGQYSAVFALGMHAALGSIKQAGVVAGLSMDDPTPRVIEVPSALVVGLEAATTLLAAGVSHGTAAIGGSKGAILRQFMLRPPQARQEEYRGNSTGADSTGETVPQSAAQSVFGAAMNGGMATFRDVDPWFELDILGGQVESRLADARVLVARGILAYVAATVRGVDPAVAAETAVSSIEGAFLGDLEGDVAKCPVLKAGSNLVWDAAGLGSSGGATDTPPREPEQQHGRGAPTSSPPAGGGASPEADDVPVLVTGPRLLPYADSLLLLRPCSSAIAVTPRQSDRRLVAALTTAKEALERAGRPSRPVHPVQQGSGRGLSQGTASGLKQNVRDASWGSGPATASGTSSSGREYIAGFEARAAALGQKHGARVFVTGDVDKAMTAVRKMLEYRRLADVQAEQV